MRGATNGAMGMAMGPSTKPKAPVTFVPHPDDAAEVHAALQEADRGEGTTLTRDELERWAETGEWPESLG